MLAEEIKKLSEDLTKRMERGFDEKEDKNLAELADMPGWQVLKTLIQSLQLSMLAPITREQAALIGSLEMIGAMSMARGLVAETLKTLIDNVENTKASIKADRDKKEDAEAVVEEGNTE